MRNENREELILSMQELTENGFRCFILKENPSYLYGIIITPSDNILYIQRDNFNMGWIVSLQYKPSAKNGTGCQCLEDPFWKITPKNILECEKQGLAFAQRLSAKLYKNSKEYISNLWNRENYEEV